MLLNQVQYTSDLVTGLQFKCLRPKTSHSFRPNNRLQLLVSYEQGDFFMSSWSNSFTEWNPEVRGRDADGTVQVFNHLNQILW